MISGKL